MPTTSWLSTVTAREALFDELTKIAEAQGDPKSEQAPVPNPNWKKDVARAAILGGLGLGAGYGAGEAVTRAVPSFFMNQGNPQTANLRGKVVKGILPFLVASGVMIGDRFRRRMDNEYRKAPEWGKKGSR